MAALPAIAGIAAVAVGGQGFAIGAAIVIAFLAPLTIVAGSSPVSGAAVMALFFLIGGPLPALVGPIVLKKKLFPPPTPLQPLVASRAARAVVRPLS